MPTLPPELDPFEDDPDDDGRPVGLLGRLREAKALTWITVVALVALSAGALSLIIALGR